jgi:hypothetical protein
MPEETKAAPLGPSLTPEAVGEHDEEAVLDEAAREKLLRPRVCPPTPAAAAMGVHRGPLLLWARARSGWSERKQLGLLRLHIYVGQRRGAQRRRVMG